MQSILIWSKAEDIPDSVYVMVWAKLFAWKIKEDEDISESKNGQCQSHGILKSRV